MIFFFLFDKSWLCCRHHFMHGCLVGVTLQCLDPTWSFLLGSEFSQSLVLAHHKSCGVGRSVSLKSKDAQCLSGLNVALNQPWNKELFKANWMFEEKITLLRGKQTFTLRRSCLCMKLFSHLGSGLGLISAPWIMLPLGDSA